MAIGKNLMTERSRILHDEIQVLVSALCECEIIFIGRNESRRDEYSCLTYVVGIKRIDRTENEGVGEMYGVKNLLERCLL